MFPPAIDSFVYLFKHLVTNTSYGERKGAISPLLEMSRLLSLYARDISNYLLFLPLSSKCRRGAASSVSYYHSGMVDIHSFGQILITTLVSDGDIFPSHPAEC